MRRVLFLLPVLTFLFFMADQAVAQTSPPKEETKGIYAVVRDVRGEQVEGYLRLTSDKIAARSKENQEQLIPVKYIKSITLEKNEEIPGGEVLKEATYKVRLENSQEIFTLNKKYTFSLNTNLGVVTKAIDSETINKYLYREGPSAIKAESEKPFTQDKSVVVSLEFKF